VWALAVASIRNRRINLAVDYNCDLSLCRGVIEVTTDLDLLGYGSQTVRNKSTRLHTQKGRRRSYTQSGKSSRTAANSVHVTRSWSFLARRSDLISSTNSVVRL
jgi:hypothetical protein